MELNISFVTAFQFLTMAYMTLLMLVLLASYFCLVVIETLEEASD